MSLKIDTNAWSNLTGSVGECVGGFYTADKNMHILNPIQDGHNISDDIFKCISSMKSVSIVPVSGLTVNRPPIAKFMGQTWGPSGANRTQVGPMLAPWTLLSGATTYYLNRWWLILSMHMCITRHQWVQNLRAVLSLRNVYMYLHYMDFPQSYDEKCGW